MKIDIEKKYIHWGVTAFVVITCSAIVIYAIFNFAKFSEGFNKIVSTFIPIIDGFLLAYLITPIASFFETTALPWLYKKLKMSGAGSNEKNIRRTRSLSIVIAIVLVVFMVGLFIQLIVPQLVTSITNIITSMPEYASNFNSYIEQLFKDYPDLEKLWNQNYENINSWATNNLIPQLRNIITQISSGIASGIAFVWHLVIGLIISIYIMSSRRLFAAQCRKIIMAVFKKDTAYGIMDEVDFINNTFRGYIGSSVVDSFIIGVICFIFTEIVQIPYAVLISVIVGVTNIIPFFGPFLGAIPSAILILLVNPIQTIYFVIFILILQQCDGNIIKPKLFGDSTGLSGFWVIASITVGGGLFGIPGMFLGVPIFAVIYHDIKRRIIRSLKKKGLPTSTKSYMNVDELPS